MTTDALAAKEREARAGVTMLNALRARRRSGVRDRALLARLRRGAGRHFGEDPDATEALFEVLPVPVDDAYRDAFLEDAHLVATLFAIHPPAIEAQPDEAKAQSFGASLRQIAQGGAENAAQRQLATLLTSDREDLPWHLRRAVTFARSSRVPINYYTLLKDLPFWRAEERGVQRRWARDFYNVPKKKENDE